MRYARNALYFAEVCGADPARVLSRTGLDAARLDQLDGWLEAEALMALWAVIVEETGDPDFGLRFGEQAQPGAVSIVGYAMLSAETLGGAVGALARYGPLVATVQAIEVDRGGLGHPATVEMVPHMSGPMARDRRQILEATMATFMAIARAVTGRPLPTVGVALAHARPPTGAATHRRVFGVAPAFDADRYAVQFEAAALGWPSRAASPVLHATFCGQADEGLRAMLGSVRARATAAIEGRFAEGLPALATVAADLAMSDRTLQRHLDDEGTSFQALCDEVRHGLAAQFLRDRSRTVQEVAGLLGYSAPSAFHRAFKRWTGQTPTAFREALREPAPPAAGPGVQSMNPSSR